jgi:hypothetical protein
MNVIVNAIDNGHQVLDIRLNRSFTAKFAFLTSTRLGFNKWLLLKVSSKHYF